MAKRQAEPSKLSRKHERLSRVIQRHTKDRIPAISSEYSRRKLRKACQLSTLEKIDLVYQVVVNLKSHGETAAMYRTKPAVVHRLIRKSKKKPHFMRELLAREEDKVQEVASVL